MQTVKNKIRISNKPVEKLHQGVWCKELFLLILIFASLPPPILFLSTVETRSLLPHCGIVLSKSGLLSLGTALK